MARPLSDELQIEQAREMEAPFDRMAMAGFQLEVYE
jgi:hypothetical protein